MVVEHEEWGIRTRNMFFIVMAVEAVALALWRSPRGRLAYATSGVLGLVGMFCLYEAGEHGGQLVYSYAGGVGIRSGDPADVSRLLLAGLYNGAQAERKAGRLDEASKLMTLAAERHPNDAEVQLAASESLLIDRKDPRAAIEKLRSIQPPQANRSLRSLRMLTADALGGGSEGGGGRRRANGRHRS
jgi:hypothetical protein